MLRFFATIIFVSAITLGIWTNLYSALRMRIYTQDISHWKFILDIVDDPKQSFNTLVFGESQTDSFVMPKLIPGERLNICLGGGTSVDGYYYLKHYLKAHPAPKKVIIAYGLISMMTKDEFYTHALTMNYFSLGELWEVGRHIDKLESLHNREYELPLLLLDYFKSKKWFQAIYAVELLSMQLSISKHQLTNFHNVFVPHVYRINQKNFNAIKQNPNFDMVIHFTRSEIADREETARKLQFNPIYFEYYKKIIELTTSLGIETYVVIAPINDIYKGWVDEKSYSVAYKFFIEMESKYPKLHVWRDPIYYPKDHFSDLFHASEIGYERFTRFIDEFSSGKLDARP